MTRMKAWQVMIALAVTGSVARGQDDSDARSQRQDLLAENLAQVHFAVGVDRATPYFPGETATVTVTLTNPTSASLEVLDPRTPGMAGFALSMLGGPGTKEESEWSVPEPFRPPVSDLDPTTILQPSQSITMTFHPEDKSVPPWNPHNSMPLHPGNYRLRFRLGGEVEFQVGAPFLETSAIVPLQEFKTYQEDGMTEPETLQYAATIVAVRLNGEHLLFAARHNVITTHEVKAEKDGTLSTRGGEPWVRLLAVPAKVTRLSGSADPNGLITLEYTTEDGHAGRVYLDKDRHPL